MGLTQYAASVAPVQQSFQDMHYVEDTQEISRNLELRWPNML